MPPSTKKPRKKFSRKDLKKPDEFVEKGSQIGELINVHRKKILIGAAVVMGVLIIAAGVYVMMEERAVQSSQVMNDALAELGKPVQSASLFSGSSEGEDEDSFASRTEKDRAVKEAFEKATEQASSATIRKMATLGEARSKLSLGQHEEAQKLYQSFVDDPQGAEPFLYLAYEGLGMCLEGQGKLDEALKQYKILEGVGDGKYTDLALYHQARVLEHQEKANEAKKIYARLAKNINEAPKMSPMLGYLQERIAGKEGVPVKPKVQGYGEPGMLMGPDGSMMPTPGAGGQGLDEEQMRKLQEMLQKMKQQGPPEGGEGLPPLPPVGDEPPPAEGVDEAPPAAGGGE